MDWLFLSKSLLLEGEARGSSYSARKSRVRLSCVVELSLGQRLSLYFSRKSAVCCMRSSSLCLS